MPATLKTLPPIVVGICAPIFADDPASPCRRAPATGLVHTCSTSALQGSAGKALPPVRPLSRGSLLVGPACSRVVPRDGGLSVHLRTEMHALLEAFIVRQKASGEPWCPVRDNRHPVSKFFYGLSPPRSNRSPSRRFGATGSLSHSSSSSSSPSPSPTERSKLTDSWQSHARLRLHAALAGTKSFEGALRNYFRSSTEDQLQELCELATPMLAYRRREHERSMWTCAQLADAAQLEAAIFAFGAEGIMLKDGRARDPNLRHELCKYPLSIHAYIEAAALSRRGVDPSSREAAELPSQIKRARATFRSRCEGASSSTIFDPLSAHPAHRASCTASGEGLDALPEAGKDCEARAEEEAGEVAAGGGDEGAGGASSDDDFVPEEEEEGPCTQGDGLMAAKARRQALSFQQELAPVPTSSPAPASSPAPSSALPLEPLLEMILDAADANGHLSVEDLVDMISAQDALRDEFSHVVHTGYARRLHVVHGYWKPTAEAWKGSSLKGSPVAAARSSASVAALVSRCDRMAEKTKETLSGVRESQGGLLTASRSTTALATKNVDSRALPPVMTESRSTPALVTPTSRPPTRATRGHMMGGPKAYPWLLASPPEAKPTSKLSPTLLGLKPTSSSTGAGTARRKNADSALWEERIARHEKRIEKRSGVRTLAQPRRALARTGHAS